jgi:hypothetical protein
MEFEAAFSGAPLTRFSSEKDIWNGIQNSIFGGDGMQLKKMLSQWNSAGKYLTLGLIAILPYPASATDNYYQVNANRLDAANNVTVDFSSSSSLNPWPTFESTKYALITVGGLKGCVTISTSQRKTLNGDTRILYRKTTTPRPTWSKADNDAGANAYSSVRVWQDNSAPAYLEFALAAKTTAYNSMDFSYTVSAFSSATTKAACEDAAKPFISFVGGVVTVSRAN